MPPNLLLRRDSSLRRRDGACGRQTFLRLFFLSRPGTKQPLFLPGVVTKIWTSDSQSTLRPILGLRTQGRGHRDQVIKFKGTPTEGLIEDPSVPLVNQVGSTMSDSKISSNWGR